MSFVLTCVLQVVFHFQAQILSSQSSAPLELLFCAQVADEHGLEMKGNVDAIMLPKKVAGAVEKAPVKEEDEDSKLEARLAQLKR